MDSVNDSFVASSKVSFLDHLQQQHPSSRLLQKINKNLIIIISFSSIILLSLIIATLIFSHIHGYNFYNRKTEPTESLEPNSAYLKTFCSVTQDPELCFTSISSSIRETDIDPGDIFAVSLKVAINNLTSLAPLMREVLLSSDRIGAESALEHCTWSFTNSLTQLNRSLSAVLEEKENYWVDFGTQPLSSDRREDLMTWLISAMSGLDICGEVLDEMGSAAVNELSVKVYKARVQVSNSRDFLLHRDKIMEFLIIYPAARRLISSICPFYLYFCLQYLVLILLLYLILRVY